MGAIESWIASLSLGPVVTVLLVLLVLIVKRKLKEHDEMYEWYVGKVAIEQNEREEN